MPDPQTTFRAEVERLHTEIFYWMTRNHHGGEKSYAKLGEIKDRLTEILVTHE